MASHVGAINCSSCGDGSRKGGGGSDQVRVIKIEPQVRPIDTTLFDFSHLASDLRIGQVTSSTRFIMQML